MKMRIKATILITVLTVVGVLSGCAGRTEEVKANSKAKLIIGYPSSSGGEIGNLIGWAREQGYLEEELGAVGYEVEFAGFTGAGPAVNEALASKEINIAAYADFPGLVAKATGSDIKLIGVESEEWNAEIIVAKDSDIKSMEDLKGKKIGYTKGTYSHKFLYDALQSVGLSIDDVEEINLSAEAESALLTGAVDALCYVDQLTSRVRYNEGAKLISSTKDQADWGSTGGIFVDASYAEENKEGLVAFFKALIRAKQDITTDYQPFFEKNAELNNLELEAYEELYLLDDGKFDYFPIDVSEQAITKIERAEQFLYEEGLISDHVEIENIIDHSYYKEAETSL